jgi:hypothetical protein
VFGVRNREPLPPLNTLTLYSPLRGSFWLANAEYRVRFGVLPTGGIPDRYHVDLMTPDGTQVVARVLEAAPPLGNDTLLGTNNQLNYTVWRIDKALANRQFQLRVTGVGFSGGVVREIQGAPTAMSGVFFIGPAKP